MPPTSFFQTRKRLNNHFPDPRTSFWSLYVLTFPTFPDLPCATDAAKKVPFGIVYLRDENGVLYYSNNERIFVFCCGIFWIFHKSKIYI